jgi:hypothetical protein
MKEKSAVTHQFCRGKVDDDSSCLYSSFRYVNGTWDTIDNKRIRSQVADRIRKNKDLRSEVSLSDTDCKTVEEYCEKIVKHNLKGSETEIKALAMVSHLQIRLVYIMKNDQGKYTSNILYYGNNENFRECACIIYDKENEHYDPLYISDMEDSCKPLTLFSRDDESIDRLLEKFINDEFRGKKIKRFKKIELICFLKIFLRLL